MRPLKLLLATVAALLGLALGSRAAFAQTIYFTTPAQGLTYCPNGATIPTGCTASTAAGATSLTMATTVVSNAAVGTVVNWYADCSPTTGCGSSLANVTTGSNPQTISQSIVVPIVAGSHALHAITVTSTTSGVLTASDSRTFDVDYTVSNKGLVVTLTDDDDWLESTVLFTRVLDQYGMKGTVFIPSPRVLWADGTATSSSPENVFQSLGDLYDVLRRGHDVMGHTIDHLDMSTLDSNQAHYQMCESRRLMLNYGFLATAEAWPFGSYSSTAQTAAQDCGLNTARAVGTLGGLAASPYSESLPPASSYAVAAQTSVQSSTTLANLQTYVTNAEAHSGGWLIINFHRLCATCGSGGTRVDTGVFASFVDWLSQRCTGPTVNGTCVKPYHAAVGGATQAPIYYSTGTYGWQNALVNGGLETYGGINAASAWLANTAYNLRDTVINGQDTYICSTAGTSASSGGPTGNGTSIVDNTAKWNWVTKLMPQCWTNDSSGTNTATWSRDTGTVHGGTYSYKLNITSYTSGSQRLRQLTDMGMCSINAVAGHAPTVSVWYQSDAPIYIQYGYRGQGGYAETHTTGSCAASKGVWAQCAKTLPAMPTYANGVFVGVYVQNVCASSCTGANNTFTGWFDDFSYTAN